MNQTAPISAYTYAADYIGRRAVSAHAGDTLSLADLRTDLKLGNGTVREAVRAVEALGLVTMRPRLGVTVNPSSSWALTHPDVLAWRREGHDQVRHEQDLVDLACAIDTAAASRITARSAAELRPHANAIVAAGRDGLPTLMAQADRDFHRAMTRSSGNALFAHLASVIAGHTAASGTPYCQAPAAAHRELVDAIEAADPSAATAVTRFYSY